MARRFISLKQDPLPLKWLESKLGGIYNTPTARTISHLIENDGFVEILAVVSFDKWTEFAVEASIATDGSKRAGSVEFFNAIYQYVFFHAGKTRLHMVTAVDNQPALNMHGALGHVIEGRMRDQLGEGKDAFMFGYTKKRLLEQQVVPKEEEVRHGRRKHPTSTRL